MRDLTFMPWCLIKTQMAEHRFLSVQLWTWIWIVKNNTSATLLSGHLSALQRGIIFKRWKTHIWFNRAKQLGSCLNSVSLCNQLHNDVGCIISQFVSRYVDVLSHCLLVLFPTFSFEYVFSLPSVSDSLHTCGLGLQQAWMVDQSGGGRGGEGVILFLFHQKMSGGHNTGLHTGRLPKEGATEVHTHVGEKDSDCYQVERSLSAYTRRRPGDVCLCLARRLLALSTVAGGAHFSIYKKTLCVGSREEVLSSYLGSLAEALSYSIYCPCSNK